jgi:hypothetical protein
MFSTNHKGIYSLAGVLVSLFFIMPFAQAQQECEVIDFSQFTHADAITSIDLFGGDITINVTATRNAPAENVNATAYDTDYSQGDGSCSNLLNGTHNDTQIPASLGLVTPPGFCTDCDGIIANVPDVDFCVSGDDTQGGTITFSGFSSDFVWEIPTYDAVDIDDDEADILLMVGTAETQVGSTDCLTNTDCGNGEVVTVTTDAHTFTEVAKFELEGSGGIDNIEVCREVDEGGEGCTPGYWKQSHHFDSWVDFVPGDDYETVFGVDASFDKTLLGALKQGGGGEKALGRHAVAALLNSSNPDVSYAFTSAEVIAIVQDAYATGDFEEAKNQLADENEQGCPLN